MLLVNIILMVINQFMMLLVRMVQDFSMSLPLVEGQGNFGSIDGDPAAAMRYTETRLAKVSQYLIDDIEKNTIEYKSNYDETEKEPSVLPAQYPNLLVNGAGGIAVGMATSIPPHNLGEIIDGTLALIENKDIKIKELMKHIPGPDFPTGGVIIGKDILKMDIILVVVLLKLEVKLSLKLKKMEEKDLLLLLYLIK